MWEQAEIEDSKESMVGADETTASDELLRAFLRQAEHPARDPENPDVTFAPRVILSVGGSLVMGLLISRDHWLEQLAEEFEAREEAGLQLYGGLLREAARPLEESPESEDEEHGDEYRHVHLQEAAIRMGAVRMEIGLWRGRIDCVEGFGFGAESSGGDSVGTE